MRGETKQPRRGESAAVEQRFRSLPMPPIRSIEYINIRKQAILPPMGNIRNADLGEQRVNRAPPLLIREPFGVRRKVFYPE